MSFASVPSREAMKRFSATASRRASAVISPSTASLTRHCISATRAATSSRRDCVSAMRISIVPNRGCSLASHHRKVGSGIAPERIRKSTRSAQSSYVAKYGGRPVRGKAPKSDVRVDASPESRACQNGELAERARMIGRRSRSAVERSDRRLRARDRDVDVHRHGRLASRELAHRLEHLLVAVLLRGPGSRPMWRGGASPRRRPGGRGPRAARSGGCARRRARRPRRQPSAAGWSRPRRLPNASRASRSRTGPPRLPGAPRRGNERRPDSSISISSSSMPIEYRDECGSSGHSAQAGSSFTQAPGRPHHARDRLQQMLRRAALPARPPSPRRATARRRRNPGGAPRFLR